MQWMDSGFFPWAGEVYALGPATGHPPGQSTAPPLSPTQEKWLPEELKGPTIGARVEGLASMRVLFLTLRT